MELESMARPLTDTEWQAHQRADVVVAQASRRIVAGNLFKAALLYERAARIPGLSAPAQVALLLVSTELLVELYESLRARPTVH